MTLRNKKTGEIVTAYWLKLDLPYGQFDFENIGALNDMWVDYKPIEPLIKDEKIRKAIKYIFPEYALVHIKKQGGKRIFEFGGARLEIDAPNENAIKHGLSYIITELCGEEE